MLLDLVLLDLNMPVRSGIEVIRWMNATAWAGPAPTVAVISASAYDERPVLDELGVSHMLPKPFRLAQLSQLVTDVVAERR